MGLKALTDIITRSTDESEDEDLQALEAAELGEEDVDDVVDFLELIYTAPHPFRRVLIRRTHDLLAQHPSEPAIEALKDFAQRVEEDPRSAACALVTLHRAGALDAEQFSEACSNLFFFSSLVYALRLFEATALIPEQYRTQERYAQAAFVDWLVHPNELGSVPHAVETLDVSLAKGGLKYYLIKFLPTPESEWMVGVAGPYLAEPESFCADYWNPAEPWSSTSYWSDFDKLSDCSLEEHWSRFGRDN